MILVMQVRPWFIHNYFTGVIHIIVSVTHWQGRPACPMPVFHVDIPVPVYTVIYIHIREVVIIYMIISYRAPYGLGGYIDPERNLREGCLSQPSARK